MSNKAILGLIGVVGAAVVAFLAFGVFGVQTLFFDDEVSEDVPTFSAAGASGLASDDVSEQTAEEMTAEMDASGNAAVVEVTEDTPEVAGEPEVVRLVEGSFIDRSHPAEGTAVVLTDGSDQRFLRLEDDFKTDNGPDLEVYLSAGVSADGDAGLFDDDFISLGDLKGNIGSQNYEILADVDLSKYSTVVVWCVRFGVAFAAADLA